MSRDFQAEWMQGDSFGDGMIGSLSPGENPHTRFVNTAKLIVPNMLTMLSPTNSGRFYPDELPQMASYVSEKLLTKDAQA